MSPTLRANPYPEVTDLLCRLPLPTLFYQLEAVHLGDLLRLSVRPDVILATAPASLTQHNTAASNSCPRIFTGPQGCTGQHKNLCCFAGHKTLSPANLIPGSRVSMRGNKPLQRFCCSQKTVRKKRKLFPGPLPPSPSLLALPPYKGSPCEQALTPTPTKTTPIHTLVREY